MCWGQVVILKYIAQITFPEFLKCLERVLMSVLFWFHLIAVSLERNIENHFGIWWSVMTPEL